MTAIAFMAMGLALGLTAALIAALAWWRSSVSRGDGAIDRAAKAEKAQTASEEARDLAIADQKSAEVARDAALAREKVAQDALVTARKEFDDEVKTRISTATSDDVRGELARLLSRTVPAVPGEPTSAAGGPPGPASAVSAP